MLALLDPQHDHGCALCLMRGCMAATGTGSHLQNDPETERRENPSEGAFPLCGELWEQKMRARDQGGPRVVEHHLWDAGFSCSFDTAKLCIAARQARSSVG
jgi:hypothetical protein